MNPQEAGTLNHLIWDSLWHYPMLYNHAGHVLHHLYVVIGNGFDWHEGRLTTPDRKNYDDNILEPPTTDEHMKLGDPPHSALVVSFEIDRLRRNANALFVRENVDLLVFDIEREWNKLYPICEYARVFTVPDDVQPDFLAGARLAIELAYGVLAKGGSLHYYIDTKSKRQRDDRTRGCVEILDESLHSINTRFGPDPRGVESNGFRLWGSFNEYVATKEKLNASLRATLKDLIPA